jgi:RNA polymerase sigma-70 factor (ECF subfamily)
VTESATAGGAAERAARESYGKLLAYLAARCGDINAAEDALAEAFAAALEHWPHDGVPRTPDAWLLVTARRRLFDGARREERAQRLHEHLVRAANDAQRALERPGDIADERLASMFACAHPAIPASIRGPLILQVVLGLDAARIASAFLVAPATMGQRLVRAKRKIAAARIPLRVPPADELADRLDAVLSAIYATFAEGWDDPAGVDPRARGLATEALWLGRLVADACPDEPEAVGLLALMLHAHARRKARRGAAGAYIPLDEQDPASWDAGAIDEAESLLLRAARANRPARFQLEAAIQSAHAARRFRRPPDWPAIVGLYDELLRLTGSPVVALNRAVAIGNAAGAPAGLAALRIAAEDQRLFDYQPYWAALAELRARNGERGEAVAAYARAIGLCIDPSARRYLADRAERLRT